MADMYVGLDFETYCDLDIKKVGLDRYISHPSFRVLIGELVYHQSNMRDRGFDWVLRDGKRETRELFNRLPDTLIVAHNSQFEEACIQWLSEFYGVEITAPLEFRDSAIGSRMLGGSSDLDHASRQFLSAGSHKLSATGSRLINKFSKGTCPTRDSALNSDDWILFHRYCKVDARAGLDIAIVADASLRPNEVLTREEEVRVTERMNAVGWPVDIHSVFLMKQRYEDNLLALQSSFFTKYGELNFRSFPQQKAWCKARGLNAKSFDALAVERMLAGVNRKLKSRFLTPETRVKYEELEEFLLLKQMLGGSSLSKLDTIIARIGHDSRLRGEYVHVGAAQTHRTSGRGVQMQNLKRLTHKADMGTLEDPSIHWTNDELAENMRQLFTSGAEDGQLIVADFSSIEARGLAYLAGQEDLLDVFREGLDPYKMQAAKSRGIAYEDVDDEARRFGKVGVLSCGYGAGWNAVQSFALKMGIELTEDEAKKIVIEWRDTNPHSVDLWHTLDSLLKNVMRPSSQDRVAYARVGNSMRIGMVTSASYASMLAIRPDAVDLTVSVYAANGRHLFSRIFVGCYMENDRLYYHKPDESVHGTWTDEFTDSKTKQKKRYSLYGGKLTGILVQSLCREIFFWKLVSIQRMVDQHNLDIIGQFHDEVVIDWQPAQTDLTLEQAVEKIKAYMTAEVSVLRGFPLAAEVKHDYRYTK